VRCGSLKNSIFTVKILSHTVRKRSKDWRRYYLTAACGSSGGIDQGNMADHIGRRNILMVRATNKTMKADDIVTLLEHSDVSGMQAKARILQLATNKEIIKALELVQTVLARQILCEILGKKKAQTALKPLIKCLDDPSSGIRAEAAQSLAKIGNQKAGAPLLQHFEHETSLGVRQMLAVALGAIKYKPAIPALIKSLRDSDAGLRGSAAWSLGELHAIEAMQNLFNAARRETDNYPRDRIEEALTQIAKSR
jgi:hypothetical protein